MIITMPAAPSEKPDHRDPSLDPARGEQALRAARERIAGLDRESVRLASEREHLRAELATLEHRLHESDDARIRLEKSLRTQARRADLAERYGQHISRFQASGGEKDAARPDSLSALLSGGPVRNGWAMHHTAAWAEAVGIAAASDLSVSVIMPTFDRASTITRAIRSAFEQTVRVREVVVADDSSTDNTLDLLESTFPAEIATGRLIVLRLAKGGVCEMRNKAIEAASGNVLAFLDSDNHWHPDHVLWVLAAIETGGAKSAYTGANMHHLSESWSRIDCTAYDRTALLRQNFIDLNCFAHRVDGRAAENFDTALSRLVDWDYIIRITKGADPVRVPVTTVEYLLDGGGLNNITLTVPIKENAERIQFKHYAEMRAHKVMNAGTEARLKAQFARNVPSGTVLPAPSPAPVAPRPAPAIPAAAPENRFALPCFGGQTLFVVLPEGLAPPEGLPLDLVRPRFVHLTGEGKWREINRTGQTLGTHERLAEGNYWYPDLRQALPTAHQLATLVAATQLTEIDMAVASLSLDAPPAVTVRCLRNQVVLRERDIEDFVFGRRLRSTLLGKVLRVPQGPADGARSADLDRLLGRPVTFLESSQHFVLGGEGRWPGLRPQPPAETIAPRPGRRRVLVLAQKVAVGGVERNTVEISRALARDHDCLYLTLEKVRTEQGSLADQAVEASAGVLDLAEIAHHGLYPALLQRIVDVYAPDTLWICNGSMWLCAEAERVRDIFSASGIVDQQVYDTEQGWIRRYSEPGIQSFDRFIAINRKIRDRFVNDMGMDPDRIDLIYSAINADRFRAARAAGHDRDTQRAGYGLPRDKTILAFMGRLVHQKRPLDFLELARRCIDRDDLHFVLTGNGVLAPVIEKALAEEGMGNVTWIRNVADTTTFWPALDGYVVTSEYEGLPIALIEAISMGVPALSSDVGDIRYVLETYDAGRVVDGFGADRFAAALGPFLDELPEMRARLADRGEEIIDFFSAETTSRQFAESFARASERRKTGGV